MVGHIYIYTDILRIYRAYIYIHTKLYKYIEDILGLYWENAEGNGSYHF